MRFLLFATSLLLWACGSEGGATPDASPKGLPGEQTSSLDVPGAEGMRLVLLGTGTPIPDVASSGPASAIVTPEGSYVVDAGAGVVRRAQAAYENGIPLLRPDKLGVLFITHLHSDHTLGLPDFIFTPWTVGRQAPVHLYGPPGLRKMVMLILQAWSQDLQIRENGDGKTSLPDNVVVHEIAPGEVFRDGELTVTAFPVSHGDWEIAFGYRFSYRGRVIVVSGDTAPDEDVVAACDGCDVLLHEVYSEEGFKRGPAQWQAYHSAYHTSTRQLAAIAHRARPETLVLYHKLLFGQTEEGLQKEVAREWDGKVVVGRDLDVY